MPADTDPEHQEVLTGDSADASTLAIDRLPRHHALATSIGFEAGLGGAAVVAAWFLDLPLLPLLTPSFDAVLIGLIAVAPLIAVFIACLRLDIAPLRRIRRFLDDSLPWLLGSCTLFDLSLISLAAGVGEELFFRGLVQMKIAAWLGWLPGLIIASVLFGLAHSITPAYVILTAAIGAYLGYLAIDSGSLVPPMIAHSAYDLIALAYLLKWRDVRRKK